MMTIRSMSEGSLSNAAALLRADFADEAAAGFPRLTRIPQTEIFAFLDYFAALPADEREALLDGLSHAGAAMLIPGQPASAFPGDAALMRYRAAMQTQPQGYRYMGVKMIQMIRSDPESLAAMEKTRAALAARPRDDPPPGLLPDLGQFQPAKSALVRKLVGRAFKELFCRQKTKLAGGEIGYGGFIGNTALTVWVDFGSMLGPTALRLECPGADFAALL